MAQAALKLVARDDADKQKALEAALSQIDRAFGKGSVMKLGQKGASDVMESYSTGSLGLDIALGIGGLPRGRVVEIYGPESSGKTTLTLQAIAEMQKLGGVAAFIDAEHALDPDYAKKLGVDLVTNVCLAAAVDGTLIGVDFSLGYQLSKKVQLVFEGINLNNEKYYVYQGARAYNMQYEQYGRTYKLSLKANLY